jgi:hypothetical protein
MPAKTTQTSNQFEYDPNQPFQLPCKKTISATIAKPEQFPQCRFQDNYEPVFTLKHMDCAAAKGSDSDEESFNCRLMP